MKENAKELIVKIQSKLPRLMELREGQKIIFRECVHLVGYDISVDFAKTCNENFKILGIKPNLADVLECFEKPLADFDMEGNNLFISFYNDDISLLTTTCTWNLSKPIENQSDELINYLLELC